MLLLILIHVKYELKRILSYKYGVYEINKIFIVCIKIRSFCTITHIFTVVLESTNKQELPHKKPWPAANTLRSRRVMSLTPSIDEHKSFGHVLTIIRI